jgi:hypothetical protein
MKTTLPKLMAAWLLMTLLLLLALTHAETNAVAWFNRFSSAGSHDDGANAVAVDGSNNVIVTGSSFGGVRGNEYTTIKYSSAGLLLWSSFYNGPWSGDDKACAVAA